jgi:hypothetical protein
MLDAGAPILPDERISDERHAEEYKKDAGADCTSSR